jgi:hypothetical protein
MVAPNLDPDFQSKLYRTGCDGGTWGVLLWLNRCQLCDGGVTFRFNRQLAPPLVAAIDRGGLDEDTQATLEKNIQISAFF